MFELIRKIQLVVEHFEKKGLKIPKENIKLFTDSEIVLIWLRSLKTRFKRRVQSLISMCILALAKPSGSSLERPPSLKKTMVSYHFCS